MFKNLRRSFVRMNMLVISLLMLLAFFTVYLLIYTNTQREIRNDLQILLAMPQAEEESLQEFAPEWQNVQRPPQVPTERPFANVPRMGFAVRVNGGVHEVIQTRRLFVPDELDIAGMVEAAKDTYGRFTLDEHTWTYQTKSENGAITKVAFIETSESKAILGNIIKIFAVITGVLLFAIWLISRWFAGRSVAPIEEAYNRQRRFIQDASHDLKTPVAIMKTNLELMSSHPGESVASQEEWLSNIRLETNRMDDLTARLLALVSAESDLPTQQKEPVRLSDTIKSCILPMEAILYEKGLMLTEDLDAEIVVLGNADDLERLVHILMENAIQYTPANGRISISLHEERRKAVLRVSNTGDGISKEDLPRIFERFYRGDAARTRQHNSYGLGLAIAQGIVQRHKGTIHAESDERSAGKLTVFAVRLPLG